MKITLLTKTIYDLEDSHRACNLKNYIPRLKKLGKEAELAHIRQQIEKAQNPNTTILEIYQMAGGDSKALQKPHLPKPNFNIIDHKATTLMPNYLDNY